MSFIIISIEVREILKGWFFFVLRPTALCYLEKWKLMKAWLSTKSGKRQTLTCSFKKACQADKDARSITGPTCIIHNKWARKQKHPRTINKTLLVQYRCAITSSCWNTPGSTPAAPTTHWLLFLPSIDNRRAGRELWWTQVTAIYDRRRGRTYGRTPANCFRPTKRRFRHFHRFRQLLAPVTLRRPPSTAATLTPVLTRHSTTWTIFNTWRRQWCHRLSSALMWRHLRVAFSSSRQFRAYAYVLPSIRRERYFSLFLIRLLFSFFNSVYNQSIYYNRNSSFVEAMLTSWNIRNWEKAWLFGKYALIRPIHQTT